MLHPNDERPAVRNLDEPLSQFQHGNVLVNQGDLSLALVFRHVTKSLLYDNVTSTRVLSTKFCDGQREYIDKFKATTDNFKMNQTIILDKFQHQVREKLQAWNWT